MSEEKSSTDKNAVGWEVGIRCLTCRMIVDAESGKGFQFCKCDNRACILMQDAATLSVFVGAADVDRAQIELRTRGDSQKSVATIPLRRWNALQTRFKQCGTVPSSSS